MAKMQIGAVICAVLAGGAFNIVLAQAPAGPMQPQSPREPGASQAPSQAQRPAEVRKAPVEKRTLAGSWKLNRAESDDGRLKAQQAQEEARSRRVNNGNGPYGGGRPGGNGYPYPGSGSPGSGGPGSGGGWGGGPYGRPGADTGGWQGDLNNARMQEFLSPATSIALAVKDAEIDLSDDQNRKRVFYTDGRKLQKQKDDKYQEMTAHWEGDRLVTIGKSPMGGELRRSFEMSPDGQQLYENIYLDGGLSSFSLSIRYVYDASDTK